MDPVVLDLGRYERGLRAQGFRLIAGVDEAGRGALAGPLVAAAVILPAEFDLEGINDSKVLTRLQREAAFGRIVGDAVAWSACRCMPTRIDRRGLHKTNVWLLRRCITTLAVDATRTIVRPPALAALHWAHRAWAHVVLVLAAILVVVLARDKRRRAALLLALLVVLQLASGAAAVLGDLPLGIVVAHNLIAAILLATLVAIACRYPVSEVQPPVSEV